ncbi:MAG TPA: GyrI-like domain-containing protein [Acidobacteriaceae bacterium]|nr:GyrI-like domain-containing protein [Acidobacteriaceae bacterium]
MTITVETTPARQLAAVRRHIRIPEIRHAWKPALDQVWDFLRKHPGLRTDGHNIFLYHHPAQRDLPMEIDFGVEIVRSFEPHGEVFPTQTPAGEVATTLHIGPYERIGEAHDAVHAWAAANHRTFAGQSWEIYGDWTDDVSKLETRIVYLLS